MTDISSANFIKKSLIFASSHFKLLKIRDLYIFPFIVQYFLFRFILCSLSETYTLKLQWRRIWLSSSYNDQYLRELWPLNFFFMSNILLPESENEPNWNGSVRFESIRTELEPTFRKKDELEPEKVGSIRSLTLTENKWCLVLLFAVVIISS